MLVGPYGFGVLDRHALYTLCRNGSITMEFATVFGSPSVSKHVGSVENTSRPLGKQFSILSEKLERGLVHPCRVSLSLHDLALVNSSDWKLGMAQ